MKGHARIRRCSSCHRLCWVYLILWSCSSHQGFTLNPSSSVHRRSSSSVWNRPKRSPLHHGSGKCRRGNNNNNNKPPPIHKSRKGGVTGDNGDGESSSPHLMGGAYSWLLTETFGSSNTFAAPFLGSVAETATMDLAQWQMFLAALLVFVQTMGIHSAGLLSTAMKRGISWYLLKLSTSPLLTKSITSGVIGVCGDYIAQSLEYRLQSRKAGTRQHDDSDTVSGVREGDGADDTTSGNNSMWNIHGTYNIRRGLAILADGLLISGPLMHWGYNIFEHVLPVSQGRSLAAMAHVLADSILLDSVFVGTTIVVTGVMEGYGDSILSQFQRDYTDTLKASWATSATLIPLEFVCFRYLPVTLRTLAMNVTDVIWDAVISFMAHRNRGIQEAVVVERLS